MIKSVTFLRHYKLRHPFDDWRSMSLLQFRLFTEGKAEPHIDTDMRNFLLENFSKDKFKEYEIIFISNSLRTKETADIINQHFSLGLDIVSNSIFNEIPSEIVSKLSEKDFLQMKHIQKLSINRGRVLNRREKIKRLKDIDDFIRAQSQNNILIISHSYLIGQLNYFYNILHRKLDDYVEIEADKYEIGGYIKGFSVDI